MNPNKGKRWISPDASTINANFVIRYREAGDKRDKLIGGGKYHELVGDELANKHFERVLNGLGQSYTIKLRRGLIIQFSSK